jgi:DNA-binding NarL/FixJ family response regulator
MATIKYAIADDHKIFRQGLRYALADDTKLKLAGEADSGSALLQLMEKNEVDVILLDLKMPGMDGIETTKKIQELYPLTKILMLTTYDDEHFIMHLLELGANGYLLKNTEPEEIKRAIHTVFDNDYYFNDLVSHTMLKKLRLKNSGSALFKEEIKLTEREAEVLNLICKEMTAAEIASKIYLSQRTVEGIKTNLMEKIGAKNTAGLVIYAMKNGIFS